MKQIKFLFLGLVATLALVGCNDQKVDTTPTPKQLVQGWWEMSVEGTSYDGQEVYVQFASNGYFNAYVDGVITNGSYKCGKESIKITVNGVETEYETVYGAKEMTIDLKTFTKAYKPLDIDKSLVGQWALKSFVGTELEGLEVYIEFYDLTGSTGRFDMYQRYFTPLFMYYPGTYWVDEEIVEEGNPKQYLMGYYDNGDPFNPAYGYELVFSADELKMINSDYPEDYAVYEKSVIPMGIIDATLGNTKAAAGAGAGAFRAL